MFNDILVDFLLNKCGDKRLADLFDIFDQFIIIVDIEKSGCNLPVILFLQCLVQIGKIVQCYGQQLVCFVG